MKNILITGCAGFIGYHLTENLLKNKKNQIFGIDNINAYYDINLKKKRLSLLKKKKNFKFYKISIDNYNKLDKNFLKNKYDIVVNLAAQAGVRDSISDPDSYFSSNVLGFYNILKLCTKFKVKHLLFASSSSVYGDAKNFPTNEKENTDNPLSFYAASKKVNEVMASSYSNIHKLKSTALRFFTVYGPYGRPDMALYSFADSINKNKFINLNNSGKHVRDFTYIDDVVFFIEKLIFDPLKLKKDLFSIYNICGNNPQNLQKYLSILKKNSNKKVKIKKRKFQIGDVYKTHGDNAKILNFSNKHDFISIEEGVEKFIYWHKKYNEIK